MLLRSIDKSALGQCDGVGDGAGADRPGDRTAARRFHHHLFLVALDLPDQHPDRAASASILRCSYIDPIRARSERFDLLGLVLAGAGLAGIAFGLSVAGLGLLPWPIVAGLVASARSSMTST